MVADERLVPWAESGTMTVSALRRRVVPVIGLDHEDAGELSLGAGRGLEAGPVHAGYLEQPLLQLVQELEDPLHVRLGLVGVKLGEAGERRHLVVDLGVVLHGARPQRIEAGVDAVVEMGQAGVVAHHLRLGDFGQRRRDLAQPHAGQQVGQVRTAGTPGDGRSTPR